MSIQNTGTWATPWSGLPQLPTIVVYLVGVVPAIWWFWLGAVDRLGADPMRELEHALGLWALRFLIFTTPGKLVHHARRTLLRLTRTWKRFGNWRGAFALLPLAAQPAAT